MKNLIVLLLLGLLCISRTTVAQENPSPAFTEQITLKVINFEGNTVISKKELHQAVAPYLGRAITPEEFAIISQEIQEKLSRLYHSKGYLFSGAFIGGANELSEGTLIVTIKELGKLTEIEVEGLRRLPKSYITSRINAIVGEPLNTNDINFALQRLQNDPRIEAITGNLRRGAGEDLTLYVTLVEAPAFSAQLEGNNYNSYLVGENQLEVTASSLNLFGLADSATIQYQRTDGSDQLYLDYGIPVNGRGGEVRLNYQQGNSVIQISPLDQFDVEQFSQTASIRYNQPVHLSPHNEVSFFVGLDWRQNESSILDQPFSFTPEIQDATTQYTALSVGQTWINRTPTRAIAIRNELRFGVDLFDATILDTPSGIDGRYFLWRFNGQYLRQIAPRWLLRANFSAQLTPDALLFGERLQIGGVYTVPGFVYNQFSGDNGYYGQIALEYTLVEDDKWGNLRVIPYFSAGFVDNNKFPSPIPDTISSVALGLDYQRNPFYLRLDYAQPLTAEIRNQNILLQFGVRVRF